MWKLRERLKKQEEEKQNRPLDPLLPCGLRRGMPGQMFKEINADFADCLTDRSVNEAGCNYTTTFDRDAAKHCGMQLIE